MNHPCTDLTDTKALTPTALRAVETLRNYHSSLDVWANVVETWAQLNGYELPAPRPRPLQPQDELPVSGTDPPQFRMDASFGGLVSPINPTQTYIAQPLESQGCLLDVKLDSSDWRTPSLQSSISSASSIVGGTNVSNNIALGFTNGVDLNNPNTMLLDLTNGVLPDLGNTMSLDLPTHLCPGAPNDLPADFTINPSPHFTNNLFPDVTNNLVPDTTNNLPPDFTNNQHSDITNILGLSFMHDPSAYSSNNMTLGFRNDLPPVSGIVDCNGSMAGISSASAQLASGYPTADLAPKTCAVHEALFTTFLGNEPSQVSEVNQTGGPCGPNGMPFIWQSAHLGDQSSYVPDVNNTGEYCGPSYMLFD